MLNIKLPLIICLLVVLVSGCTVHENKDDNINIEFNEGVDQSFWRFDNITKTKEGYYTFYDDVLYFIDEETMTSTVMCFTPNCTHDNERCNAFFGTDINDINKSYNTTGIVSTKDKLYILGMEQNETADVYLYSISKDAQQREKVCYLYSLEQDGYSFDYVLHNNYMYRNEYENNKGVIKQINPENGERKIIYELEGYEIGIDSMSGYGDYLYYNISYFTDEALTNLVSYICRYNVKTGEAEEIVKDFICNEFYVLNDNQIVYMDLEYNVIVLSIDTKETKIIRETDGNFGRISFDGKYIYYTIAAFDYDSQVEVYDTSGTLINNVPLYGGQCNFGDAEHLIMTGMQMEKDGETDENVLLYYIDKENIENKDVNWKEVKK